MKIKLSPSTLDLMIQCERCFWMQIKQGIRKPSTPFPSLPNGIDKILKEYYDAHIDSGILPKELNLKGYKLFKDKEKLAIWRNNFRGLEYFDKASGIMLMGAIDHLLTSRKLLTIIDFKTRGSKPKEETALYYKQKLEVYNFLLMMNGYCVSDFSFLIFYYPEKINENGDFIFKSEVVKVPTNPVNGERLFLKAIKILQGDIPRPNSNCEFCKWRRLTR